MIFPCLQPLTLFFRPFDGVHIVAIKKLPSQGSGARSTLHSIFQKLANSLINALCKSFDIFDFILSEKFFLDKTGAFVHALTSGKQ